MTHTGMHAIPTSNGEVGCALPSPPPPTRPPLLAPHDAPVGTPPHARALLTEGAAPRTPPLPRVRDLSLQTQPVT